MISCVFVCGYGLHLFTDRSRHVLLAPEKRAAAAAVPDEDAAAEARRLRATRTCLAGAL